MSKWESGAADPSTSNLLALAKLYGVSPEELLKSVELFDVYECDKLPVGKKSYAVNFILEDKERTLTDTVINKVIGNILHNLESKLGAQQR